MVQDSAQPTHMKLPGPLTPSSPAYSTSSCKMEIIPGVTPHSWAFLNSETSSEEGGEQFKQQGVMPQASALLGDQMGGGNLWSCLTVLSGILVILKETFCVYHIP